MIRLHIILFVLLSTYGHTVTTAIYPVGTDIAVNGHTYRVAGTATQRCEFSGPTSLQYAGTLVQIPNTGQCASYYRGWVEFTASQTSSEACQADSNYVCYQNLCGETAVIDGSNYIKNNIGDSETCTTNPDGTNTGNLWQDAATCSAAQGACYVLNTCFPPVGYSSLSNVNAEDACNVRDINVLLPITTTMIVVEALWQACDTTCYVKSTDIDCGEQTPYVPTLEQGETIYSTDITLEECVSYANSQNMDARYDTYSTEEAPGFSCQNLKFCIVKDRPHTCQGIDTPLPSVSANETYFIINSEDECTTYGTQHDASTRVVHFDDKDNAGRFCFDVNYCVVSNNTDNNNTSSDNENNTTTLDNTGTHGGTGVSSVDLNGTNDRLDVIDGHIKDGNQVNRQGFDRNHNDLNQLSQDIQDASELINRGINGLTHSIGTVLDHLKNGEINSTGSALDDSGIIEANNNTTSVLSYMFEYIKGDGNYTNDFNLSNLNLADLNLSQLYDAASTLNDELDTNLTKQKLIEKIEDEISEHMQDFNDKSEDTITTVFDYTFANLFNPFEPFITTGSNLSNFKKIELPIVISSLGFSDSLSFSSTDVFGSQGSALSNFYEIMRVILSFIAVIAGFMYLLEELNNG